jgi:hypothetical protein
MAHTADGVFDITGDILTVVQAPGITRAMLAAFGEAVKKAYEEKKPPEELAEEVEKIDPSFGPVVRRSGVTPGYYLLILLIILAAIRSCSFEYKVDVNQLIEQLQHTPPASVISAPDPPPLSTDPDVAQPP